MKLVMVRLLYGSGMRLMECLRLRINDSSTFARGAGRQYACQRIAGVSRAENTRALSGVPRPMGPRAQTTKRLLPPECAVAVELLSSVTAVL